MEEGAQLEQSIIEVRYPVESSLFIHTSLCEKKMQVGMKIDSGPKRLDDGNNICYTLYACYGPEIFEKCLFAAENFSRNPGMEGQMTSKQGKLSHLNRRQFLKTVGLGTAALAFSGPQTAYKRGAFSD